MEYEEKNQRYYINKISEQKRILRKKPCYFCGKIHEKFEIATQYLQYRFYIDQKLKMITT